MSEAARERGRLMQAAIRSKRERERRLGLPAARPSHLDPVLPRGGPTFDCIPDIEPFSVERIHAE